MKNILSHAVFIVMKKTWFRKVITVNPDFSSRHDDDKFEYRFLTDNKRTLAWLGKFIHESLSKCMDT